VPILAGGHDERLSAEEFGKLGRDEGVDHAADLGRCPVGAGSPLNGALTLVKQGGYAVQWRARGGGGSALGYAPPARLFARRHLRSRDDQLAGGFARLHDPVRVGDVFEGEHPRGLGLVDARLGLGDDVAERDR
jgi:hypothetical protein